MSYWTGRITLSSTGPQSFVLGGFQPTWARFRIGGLASGDTSCHIGLGSTDGTRQNCSTAFSDGTGSFSSDDNTKCVSFYARVSGNITEVLNASFNAFTSTGITLNVTTASTNYKVTVECGN